MKKNIAWIPIERMLKNMEFGRLTVILPDGTEQTFTGKGALEESGTLRIKDWNIFKRVINRGDVGFGEAYIEGEWDSPDIVALLTVLARNADRYNKDLYAGRSWQRLFLLCRQWLRRNTKMRSRSNIKAHYDVGNAFYKLWLDETMSYSSALFDAPTEDLAAAQRNKYRRILGEIGEAKSIWEIGCGWGGFAEEALLQSKTVYGISLSREQLRYAEERLAKWVAGKECILKYEDYRDTDQLFDAVVSIEMIEAVGEEYWATYFGKIKKNLRPGGKGVIQVIFMPEEKAFEQYRKGVDFIRQYTFPGGMLLSPKHFRAELAKAGLVETGWHSFGLDYAKTLVEWLARLDAAKEKIQALGYSDEFIRSWRYYLALCAAGFLCGRTDVSQVSFTNPLSE